MSKFQIWNSGGGQSGGANNVLTFNNDNDLAYIVENDNILGALYKQIHDDPNITVHYDSRVNQCNLPETPSEMATVKVANAETTYETSLLVSRIY
jgi:2-polyprenyl-6-methoxyphenol hydroxylase-like FAD-dependent oxidoreductase